MDINSTKPYLCCHDRSDKVRGCVFIFYRHPNIDDLTSWTYNKHIRIKTINIWYYPMWLATENANIQVIVTPRRDVRWCWSVSTQATGNLLQDYGLSCVIVCNEQYDLDPHRWNPLTSSVSIYKTPHLQRIILSLPAFNNLHLHSQ